MDEAVFEQEKNEQAHYLRLTCHDGEAVVIQPRCARRDIVKKTRRKECFTT